MKKQILTLTILSVAALAMFGCGKKKDDKKTTETKTTEVATEDPHAGMYYKELTGEWFEEPIDTDKRPVAVMINNLKEALPSASTKKADIIYECMVEGGITRIMPIFTDYEDLEKLGSVRSARHYFINIANEYDALYVHFGQSKPAKAILDEGVIDNMNGLTYDPGFYRDDSRVAPHNAYTTGEKIVNGFEHFEYDTKYAEDHEKVFSFNDKDKDLKDGETASTVHVNFSSYSKPYFVYNEETKLYERYEYNAPQIDELEPEDNNVLTFKNVIVQMSSYECINPKNDLQELTQVGGGDGYYCTNGKAIPITWKKETAESITKYYTEDGKELLLNPGKTWISIIGNGSDAGVAFE